MDDTIADRQALRPPASAAVQPQPDGSYLSMVSTTTDKFTDGFNGSSLQADKWDIVRNTGGMIITVAAGQMAVNMGLTDGAELLLVAKQDITIPANVMAVMSISQRIAGNDVSFGYLEVDPDTGAPIPHATLTAREFRNSVRKTFLGTSTSTALFETMSTDAPAVTSVTETLVGATTGTQDHIIFARADDCVSSSQLSNNTGAKSGNGARISTQCPSPNRVYRPFIHLRNTAVPATVTTVTFPRFVSLDMQELEVQASMGQGVSLGSAGIPVVGVGGSFGIGANVAIGHRADINGTVSNVPSVRTTTADTNRLLLKAAAGKIVGGRIRNKAAYEIVLKFYNRTTLPTVGTDAPFFKIAVLPGTTVDLHDIFGPAGLYFSSGIAYAITQLEADSDATALALGDALVALLYV